MHMLVNYTRQQVASFTIDHSLEVFFVEYLTFYNGRDTFSLNDDSTCKLLALIDYGYIMDKRSFHFLNNESHFKRMTPNMASPKILLFILEVPSLRLTKMTGTSLMRKPSCQAVNFISIWKA